jgi:hypothetical protein
MELIEQWLNNPNPLWNTFVTRTLVSEERYSSIHPATYSIANTLTGLTNQKSLIKIGSDSPSIFLELPSESLYSFYNDHGLKPLTFEIEGIEKLLKKLGNALDFINLVPTLKEDITLLVRTIQLLKSDYPENDVSYSHPEIPFSIFLSLSEEETTIGYLRIAESIIHEAMHLKLTLIEKKLPLIESETRDTFFSPWRDEMRPVRGVLHGLFVFRVINEFYRTLNDCALGDPELQFLTGRINAIRSNIEQINRFETSNGLNKCGKAFVSKLLQS